jgi:hypothetical protein
MPSGSHVFDAVQGSHSVSDKWGNYFSVYERLFASFRDEAINFLEIGVQNGGSLLGWASYFRSAQKIVGCDINPGCSKLRFQDPRISVVIVDIKLSDTQQKIFAHTD